MASFKHKDLSAYFGCESLNENICKGCHVRQPRDGIRVCNNCLEHLCDQCYAIHSSSQCGNSQNKEPREKRSLSLTSSLKLSLKKSFSFRRSNVQDKCPDHPDKVIKYYCQKHDCLGCSICIALGHMACEDTEFVIDVSQDIKKIPVYTDFITRLQDVITQSYDHLTDIDEKISQIQSFNTTAVEEIENFRKQINVALDEMEKELHNKLKEIYDEDVKDLDTTAKSLQEINKEGKLLIHQLKSLTFQKQNSAAYITMRKNKQLLERLETDLKQTDQKTLLEKKHKSYIFLPDNEILENLQKFTRIGELIFLDKTDEATPVKDIDIKSDTDTSTSWITGMTILTEHTIAAADRNNRKVKLIDTEKEEITAEIVLTGKPWDITKVQDENQVVVTIPNRKRLVFININQDLKVSHEFSVREPCYGVVYINQTKTLAVTYAGHHKVEILDLDGIIIKIVQCSDTGLPLFQTPCHITADQDKALLYVSNSGNNAVHCMTQDGAAVASYTDTNLKHLRQVALGKRGHVYACGAPNDILQINPITQAMQLLIAEPQDEFQAFSIAFNNMAEMAYIGMENMDIIKVFMVNPIKQESSEC